MDWRKEKNQIKVLWGKFLKPLWLFMLFLLPATSFATEKQPIKALYIPLADHYAALVAYEKYASEMQYAEFTLLQMKSWDLLRGYFNSEDADLAFVMSPLALDMFLRKPNFRWIGLMHRDGNALAINESLNQLVQLPASRLERKPDQKVALALRKKALQSGTVKIGIPHQLSTHAVVLFSYLKQNGVSLSVWKKTPADVLAVPIAPPQSPQFIKNMSSRSIAAGFEQSLPWADVVETQGYGYVAWYSKDVLQWPNGHVECIAIAKDEAIATKQLALKEVMAAIQKAGKEIEVARAQGGEAMEEITAIVRKHIPLHTEEAITASLSTDLNAINYNHLSLDKAGMKLIMDLAVEGDILREPVDLDLFSDDRFSVSEPIDNMILEKLGN